MLPRKKRDDFPEIATVDRVLGLVMSEPQGRRVFSKYLPHMVDN
jgi:hypothetical protein